MDAVECADAVLDPTSCVTHEEDGGGDEDLGGDRGPGDSDSGDPSSGDPATAGTWYGFGGSDLTTWPARVDPEPATGGLSNSAGDSWLPALVMSPSGEATVAWQENNGGERTYLRTSNGEVWQELAGSGSGSLSGNRPTLALDENERPVVGWLQAAGGWRVVVKHFTGTAWEGLEGASDNGLLNQTFTTDVSNPNIAYDVASHTTYLTWINIDGVTLNQVYVLAHDAGGWHELGAGSASGGGVSNSSADATGQVIAVNPLTGYPLVAWADRSSGEFEIYCKQWSGSTWEELGGSASAFGVSNTGSDTGSATVAFDTSGHPAIAWNVNSSNARQVLLRMYDGANWVALGDSADIHGISRAASGDSSWQPSLGYDPTLGFIVAWGGDHGTETEIYVRHFDGTNWVDIDGSATDGGVSNSAGNSTQPSLGVGGGRACVVWTEEMTASKDVMVRCTDAP